MNSNPMPLALRRWLASVLAILIGLGPIATPAYAALIPLADEPLNVKNSAHPNIVLTVDDSTSMLFDFLPDYVASAYCRGGTGAMTAACGNVGAASDFTLQSGGKYFSPGYAFEQYNYPYSTYTKSYDPSGPGAGCYGGTPPTCSSGIDPGPLPGISAYPVGPQLTWPNSQQPYEYWLLWPAPAHSASLNALYYDPRLTYDPPVDSTGTSYKQMDAGNTGNWTAVPADPWAATIVTVDLTAPITDGLWCDSDWNLPDSSSPSPQTDPKRCRYNGQGGAAFGTVSLADGQDYTYPWAPPNFVLPPAPAASTTQNIYAAQKVTLDASLTGTATTALWANAQNQKYFYENENVIWCDPTSPSWPQTGAQEVCGNFQTQTCGGNKQTCDKDPGNCSGNPSAAACNGWGTCQGFAPATCNGTAGTCTGALGGFCNPASCSNKKVDLCNGTTQTCTGITSQTCSGPLKQTCQLPGTQTCQPPVCGTTYSPAGCNLLPPDPENPCTATTTCGNPVCTPDPGTCSLSKTSCSKDSDCTDQSGVCSISGRSCGLPTDQPCGSIGHCSIDTATSCTSNSDCPIKGGTCRLNSSVTCTQNTDCTFGTCSSSGAICQFDSACGTCNTSPFQACTDNSICNSIQGSCNQKICVGGTNAGKPCPAFSCTGGGTCTTVSCGSNADCPVSGGKCTNPSNQACTLSSQCSTTKGTCTNANKQSCDGATQADADNSCPAGTCANTQSQSCRTACTNIQFDANSNDTSCGCPVTFGVCKGSKITPAPACYATACNQGQTQFCCSNILTCSGTHSSCNSNVDCPDINPICSITGAACTGSNGFPDASQCPQVGKCGVSGGPYNGKACTSSGSCPPGPLTPSAAVCSTGGVAGDATKTLRNDAENNGVVCRRNNKTSGTYTSGPYTYPSGKFLTPVTSGTGADACPATNHYVSTPRHYWKSEVQWCDKKIAVAGDKWLGYGTDAGGTCQAGKDSTHIYPRFFQFGAASYVDNYATAAFRRVDLDVNNKTSYTHAWIDATGQMQTITRSFDQEMTNYANWFAYYRTRIQAVKTVTSLTFTALDDQYRVGFHTLSNGATTPVSCGANYDPATFVDIADFDTGQKKTWYAQLFGITIPLCLETPTLDAMARIGEYFKNGGSPELGTEKDPIILSCQKNWHMLFTDGFTNQPKLPAVKPVPDDQDLTVPSYPDCPPGPGLPPGPIPGLTTGQAWPHPFQEDPTAKASDAASDYSMYYWVTDLRTSGSFANDNVPATTKDPACWQHLNFAAMSLGTQGKLPIANQSVTENLLAAGTLQWPQPYPTVFKPDNSGVDDLWHAAINGRGRFVNAQSADELKLGMGQILQDITNQAGSRAGVGLASSSISLSNHSVYRVTFQPGWAGTVTKIDIDVSTGAELSNLWEAAQQLHTALTPTASDPTCVTPGSCPWFTNRKIFTVDDTNTSVPFLWASLSAAQQDSLAPGLPAVGQAVASYLRGDPTNEGVSLGQFRVRGTASFGENFLGDIVDSQAVYAGPPNAPYLDGNDPGYSSFASAQSSRPARVYAGGNDGMLHAFDDATGDEAWAFIPHDLYRPDNTGLGALAYQDGALPPFRHHFYVDSTPRIVDVDFGGGSWHSLLVGGLGKGGKSYYALDVTNPGAITTEAKATSQYLWTFTDADMGYTYGKPMLAKTRAFGGKWLMVVSAGYDNPSGVGKIFFVDAKTGKKLKEMTTPVGLDGVGGTSSTNPSGLVHIAGYTEDFRNQLIDQIYGGDLYGNLWRFDVSDTDDSKWTVDEFAYFTDPTNGLPQPVTTAPQIEVDLSNSTDRWVFIGTGRLLDDTDLTDPNIAGQVQTFYAMRDGTTTTPNPITAPLTRADLVSITDPANGDPINGLKTKPVHGWYQDLPAGQRVITPVQAALSVVAYAGTSPQDNPCLTGEPATLYVREFSLGSSLLDTSDFPGGTGVNSDGGIAIASGAVGLDIAIFSDSSGANSASDIDIRVAVTAGTTGDVVFQHVKPPAFLAAHRMSWRLLGQ
jgi:type IV pilus assembly protein PilY1